MCICVHVHIPRQDFLHDQQQVMTIYIYIWVIYTKKLYDSTAILQYVYNEKTWRGMSNVYIYVSYIIYANSHLFSPVMFMFVSKTHASSVQFLPPPPAMQLRIPQRVEARRIAWSDLRRWRSNPRRLIWSLKFWTPKHLQETARYIHESELNFDFLGFWCVYGT